MSKKQNYILMGFLLIVWLLCTSILRSNLNNDITQSVRWFNDHNDRWVYMLRGQWLPEGKIPFKDVESEYPQIPTYLFGLIYLLVPKNSSPQMAYFIHSSAFSFIMFVFLYLTIRLLYELLPQRKWLAFLVLLPASLYFTYNRFDIMPAFFSLWCLLNLKCGKTAQAGILLGIAALTKWYPALFLPVFLVYHYTLTGKINWKLLLAFAATCIVILLPTLVLGGWKALLSPYLLHAERGLEEAALPMLLNFVMSKAGLVINAKVLIAIFLFLQLTPSVLSLFARIDRFEKVIQWTILISASFTLFSRIYSPQWLVWLAPFLLLTASNLFDIFWILFYNIVTYLNFPVLMDAAGKFSTEYTIGGALAAMILAVIIGVSAGRAEIRFSWNFLELLGGPFHSPPREKTA